MSNSEGTEKPDYKKDYGKYKQEWDRSRQQQNQKRKKSGQNNMGFFTKLVKSMKLNYKRLSEITGYSQQLISWWISSDDCKYSNIIDIFDKAGISISCHFEPSPDSKYVITQDRYAMRISNLPNLNPTADNHAELVIDQVLQGNGRMRFLAEFIDKTGIGLSGFCTELGVKYFTVYQWFKKDDIKISKIYIAAEKFKQNVIWEVTAKAPAQTPEDVQAEAEGK